MLVITNVMDWTFDHNTRNRILGMRFSAMWSKVTNHRMFIITTFSRFSFPFPPWIRSEIRFFRYAFKIAITPVKMYSSDSIKNFPGFPWSQYCPTLPILSTSNQKGTAGFIIGVKWRSNALFNRARYLLHEI